MEQILAFRQPLHVWKLGNSLDLGASRLRSGRGGSHGFLASLLTAIYDPTNYVWCSNTRSYSSVPRWILQEPHP